MTTSQMTYQQQQDQKKQGSGLTVKAASWISVAMMLTCIIYLSIAPVLDAQSLMPTSSQNSVSTSSVHYLA